MKYRPTEQCIVDTLEKEIDKVNRKLEKLGLQKQVMDDKFQEKVTKVTKAGVLLQVRITKLNARVKKRCKHECGRSYWSNMRDDRSFERFCQCKDCDEILWDECKWMK